MMEFTFIWNITHFHRLANQLHSPTFMVEAFEHTQWRIMMQPILENYGKAYRVTLCNTDVLAGPRQKLPNFTGNNAITFSIICITHDIIPINSNENSSEGLVMPLSRNRCNSFNEYYSTNFPHNKLSNSFSLGCSQTTSGATPCSNVKLVFSLKKGTGKSVNVGQCSANTHLDRHGNQSNGKEVEACCGEDMVTCNQPASTALKQDILSMFQEGLLSDMELKTKTKSFPVHACVLSARSPVFRAMFTTDMKESKEKSVSLPDLDENTVSSMLNFIYQDSVGKLQWDSAVNLYCAADKYQILPLKLKCSNFLESQISVANACDALLLADMCQDKSLKIKVQKFIKGHKKEILNSDNWLKLEKKNGILSLETLRQILLDD